MTKAKVMKLNTVLGIVNTLLALGLIVAIALILPSFIG